MATAATLFFVACDDEDNLSGNSSDTSGAITGDTSGSTSGDSSGSTSGDSSGSTSGDSSGSTSGDTSGITSNSIVDIAAGNPDFSTLTTALEAADLISTLQGDGPFTVFAPTNAAFAKIPEADLNKLLLPENKAVLTEVLLYHATIGEYDASQVLARSAVTTLQGNDAAITTDGGPQIDGASITATDIPASNGIVHVIDTVMMPPTIADVAASNPEFSTLVAALEAADLLSAVSDPYAALTVFAPTNAAFEALPPGTLDSLLLPENKDQLAGILLYHVVSGELDATAVTASSSLATLQGTDVSITTDGGPKVNTANITVTDITTANGIIHVIDAVLLPQ